jgi:prevent-host-death family protein
MNAITVGELRQNPTRMLDEVEHGATYVVTRHGRKIARIVPIEEQEEIVPARKRSGSSLGGRSDLPHRSAEEIDALVAWVKGDRRRPTISTSPPRCTR